MAGLACIFTLLEFVASLLSAAGGGIGLGQNVNQGLLVVIA